MLKLYFKKLLSMIGDIIICLIVMVIFSNILFTISNFFVESKAKSFVLLGIPFIVSIIVIQHYRFRNDEKREAYLNNIGNSKFSFKSDIKYMYNLPDFRAEVLAFSTLILLFVLAMIVGIENEELPIIKFIAGLVVFLVFNALYIVFDFLLWVHVHIRWRKISDRLKH